MKLAVSIFLSFAVVSCNNTYKAGNLVALDYPIETKLRTEIIQRYVDTLILTKGYAVPEKWKHFDKLVDLDSIYHKRIYFKEFPEEMFLISYGGMLVLNDVYNPTIKSEDWVSERTELSKDEEERIKNRFKSILDMIESMAKQNGVTDSIIYKE